MDDKKETNYDRYVTAEAEKERLLKSKTPARKIAEDMDLNQTYPMSSKLAKKLDAVPLEERKSGYALQSALGMPASMMVDMVTGPRKRSEEDMSELTREVSRAQAKKKGGMIKSSASKRADGIAERGKTRGTIIACEGGYMKGKK